jgi:hypothetical protein
MTIIDSLLLILTDSAMRDDALEHISTAGFFEPKVVVRDKVLNNDQQRRTRGRCERCPTLATRETTTMEKRRRSTVDEINACRRGKDSIPVIGRNTITTGTRN